MGSLSNEMFINRPKLIRKQMDKHVAEGMVDQVNK